ncbi:hypothetical protein HMPREF1326_02519 [Akkermansia sp. KLE1605]|nr:hypothetical protein HMPREF1326_02519 [Akkermansia sp. KLE1605]
MAEIASCVKRRDWSNLSTSGNTASSSPPYSACRNAPPAPSGQWYVHHSSGRACKKLPLNRQ